MLDICKYGDEVLRTVCQPVTEFDDSLAILTDAMFDTLEEADGVGLAAPQIGVDKRFFIVWLPETDYRRVYINPQITETSVETGPYNEGCLSIPNVYHDVIRPLKVTVCAQDVNGKFFTEKADGLLARVIQHEYDHLEGKMFIDHLSEEDRQIVVGRYMKKAKGGKGRKR